MRVSEGQALGALTLLVISLTVYGVLLLSSRNPVREPPIVWGDQGPGLMAVEVTGGPGREGIYFLPEKMTVEEVLLIAGIPITDCLKKINRGGISAGSALMVSPQGEVKIGEMAAARRLALGLPIDINQASQEDLLLVPGIGEKTAYRIIQLRKQRGTFRDLSDLVVVPGIKEKKLNGLKRYLIAGQAP